MVKKRSFISTYWLKYTDRTGYKNYKWELHNYKNVEAANFLIGDKRLQNPAKIRALAAANHQLNLNHSGNAGDIIYALPTIKKLAEIVKVPINLYLRLGQPLLLSDKTTHPLGNVRLNDKMMTMLAPLIRSQSYISRFEVLTDQEIDIDLDYFRAGHVPMDRCNIAHWCSYITGINSELWKKWLDVEPDTSFAEDIIIARSERYRSKGVDYKFLKNYNNLKFIGVESEYNDIKKQVPHIEWMQVDDFLQMARIIAGCKFFIGNQSFPFSIAEALKVPRILEACFDVINVVPEGENGYDFLFQDHFESLVQELYSKSKAL